MVELRVFPDVVMGIGGAGKNLVFQMLKTEWLVRALLENTEKKYSFIILDTAVGEMKDDLKQKGEIDRFIEGIAEEMNVPKNIDIEVRNIIQDLHIDTPQVLYTKNLIEELHRKKLVKVWWILDPEHGVNNIEALQKYGSSGFSKGTIRRRGVTKAMFYKALVEGRVDEIFSIKPGAMEVAIIVGLGGGTGSGLFIDVARKIKDSNPGVIITLFGILPSLEEGEEKANAYIALSELEYMRLMQGKYGEMLFNHVVLSTIQPTRFRGSDDAYSRNVALREFSEAFVYTFLNFYDAKSGNQSDAIEPGHYGRFTLATSGIVRYEVESTVSNKKELDEAVTALMKALKIEENIRENNLNEVINALKSADMIDPLGGDNTFYSRYLDYIKNTRLIQEFYGFLTNPVLRTFNYNSPKNVMEEINTRILIGDQKFSDVVSSLKTPEEILEFISQLKTAIESAKSDFRDDVDKKIYETFTKILDNIQLSIEQLSVLHKFRFPEPLKKKYEAFETEMGTALRDLATFEAKPTILNKIDDLRRVIGTEVSGLERRVKEIDEELKNLEREKSQIESEVEEVIDLNTKLLRNYYRFIRELPEIEGLIRESSRKITRVLEDLKTHVLVDPDSIDKNIEPEMIARQMGEDVDAAVEGLKNLASKLEMIFPNNTEVLTLKDLVEYIELVKETLINYYGYLYYDYRQRHRSFGEKLRGRDYSVERDDYLDRYEKAYSKVSRRKEMANFIRIRPGPEPDTISNVEINKLESGLALILKRLNEAIQDSITTKIAKRLNVELTEVSLDKIASNSKSPQEFITKAKEAIYDAILIKNGIGEKFEKLTEERAKLTKNMEELQKFQGVLTDLRERIVDTRSRIQKEWKEHRGEYEDIMRKLKRYLERNAARRNEKGTFIYKVQPSPEALGLLMDVSEGNLARILQNPDLNTISQKEFGKILNTFRELLHTLIMPEYSGVNKYRRIVGGEVPIEWSFTRVLSYVNSPVNENVDIADKLKDVVKETLERTMKPKRDSHIGTSARGGPWDIAITIFLPKTFFEDIYGLYMKNNSYYDAYYSLKQSGIKREIFHHVYKLEDGWYIEREPMDFDEAVKLASDEQSNKDVTNRILSKCYTKHNVIKKRGGGG